jgi:malate/lactate dehydrogenase
LSDSPCHARLRDRTPESARGLVADVQYGATLSLPVTVRAGDYSDLRGAALVMVTAGVNEKTGSYNPEHGVTLSLPGIVGREGVLQTLDPERDEEEREGLLRSIDTLKAALGRIRKSELQPS